MFELKARLLLALGATALLLPAAASAITVDGQIGDWGVSGLENKTADYTGVAGTAWDTSSYRGDGFLTPGGGAQNYDTEFLAAHVEGNTLYGVIMTGQRADNGFDRYSPGDIFLEAYDANLGSNVLFGIEVGGGAGGAGISSVGLGDAGTTYLMQSSGYTAGTQATPYLAGDLVRDPNYVGGEPFGNAATGGDMVQMVAGAGTVGTVAEYIYNQDASLGQHAIIEFALDLGVLNLGDAGALKSIRWSPGCGNDPGKAGVSGAVPEPTAALLMTVGMLTVHLGGLRRRSA